MGLNILPIDCNLVFVRTFLTFSEPGSNMAQWSRIVGGMNIEWGWAVKNAIDLSISFRNGFSTIPAITLSSEWPPGGVGYVETLHKVTRDGFTAHSANRASNYYVNWIAIGLPRSAAAIEPEMQNALDEFEALSTRNQLSKEDDSAGDSTKGET